MSYVSLVLEMGADKAERFSDALLEAGALAVSIEDPLAGTPSEVAVYGEPGWPEEGQAGAWQWLKLLVLLNETDGRRAHEMLAAAAQAAGLPAIPPFEAREVADQDWVRQTQAQFEPIRISNQLWIVPSWHDAPDPNAISIVLDPGIAFGTGSHPTTKLCLRWLEHQIKGGETVLDYGCGSGILAIAAAKLGAARVFGVDIDASAVAASRLNAARNGVQADFLSAEQALTVEADLVAANILANPLKLLASLLAGHVCPGGRIALSGVLTAQADEVRAAYDPWFQLQDAETEDGWVCLSGPRRATSRA